MNKTGKYISERKNLLSIYFTADYPYKGSTKDIIVALQNAGADLLEVGIPFSDPLADGVVIQKSSYKALENGFLLDNLFADLEEIRPQITIPLVLMGYFNTVLAYDVEKFLKKCHSLGIDTIIFPDLPPVIYVDRYADLFEKYDVSPVFLITPQTSDLRINYLNGLSKAFIYAVADNSITGASADLSDKQLIYFNKIKATKFDVPVMIGFGISDKKAYEKACNYANGVIIGSAFIKSIENITQDNQQNNQQNNNEISKTITDFIHSIKK